MQSLLYTAFPGATAAEFRGQAYAIPPKQYTLVLQMVQVCPAAPL
jgi:hypothetical protein